MPQTTECALTHRLPSNTTTAARSPADLPPPPVEEGRGGVLLHTANAKSSAVLLPPPWERVGVEAAKKRAATKPHRTSSFTYTPSAQAYVKKTIGCALAHRLPSDTTTAARPPADLLPPPVGEGQGGVRPHTANAKSPAVLLPPPRGRDGVGTAKKPRSDNTHSTTPFTYTSPAILYVKPAIGCALAHRRSPDTTTAARIPTVLPPPSQDAPASAAGEGRGGGSASDSGTNTTSPATPASYSHPPKASYCVALSRRTTAYCLRQRALSETFGGWLYIHPERSSVCKPPCQTPQTGPPMSHEILRHVYWTFGSETCPDAHAFNEAVTACNTGLTWHLEHSA